MYKKRDGCITKLKTLILQLTAEQLLLVCIFRHTYAIRPKSLASWGWGAST